MKLLGCFDDEPPLTKAYNFMYEKPSTVGEVLSDMTLNLAEEMQDIMLKKGEEEEEYSNVNIMTSVSINVLIVCYYLEGLDLSLHVSALL